MQRPRQPLLRRFEDQTFLRIKNAVSTKTERVSLYTLLTCVHTYRHEACMCVDSVAVIDYDTQQLLRCEAPVLPTPAGVESARTPAPRPFDDRDLLGFLSTELDLDVGGSAAAVAGWSVVVRSSDAAAGTSPGSVFCRCCINRTRFCCAESAAVSETERKRSASMPSRFVRREQLQRRRASAPQTVHRRPSEPSAAAASSFSINNRSSSDRPDSSLISSSAWRSHWLVRGSSFLGSAVVLLSPSLDDVGAGGGCDDVDDRPCGNAEDFLAGGVISLISLRYSSSSEMPESAERTNSGCISRWVVRGTSAGRPPARPDDSDDDDASTDILRGRSSASRSSIISSNSLSPVAVDRICSSGCLSY